MTSKLMRYLVAAILIAAGFGWSHPKAAAESVDLELVLAADGSGSIDPQEFKLQRAGYAAAITSPDVLSAIRGGYHQAIALAYTVVLERGRWLKPR